MTGVFHRSSDRVAAASLRSLLSFSSEAGGAGVFFPEKNRVIASCCSFYFWAKIFAKLCYVHLKTVEVTQSHVVLLNLPVMPSSVLRHQISRTELPAKLPKLNDSQLQAVAAALNNNFTLIQGPPGKNRNVINIPVSTCSVKNLFFVCLTGTGKTVVGVNIVYWFLKMNSENPRISEDPRDKDKKEVILYCGPSNKSVDVVAGKFTF